MSLDKAIESGKEHRKPYTGSKSFVKSCRNHGGCSWCLSNRTHKYNKKKLLTKQEKYDIITISTKIKRRNIKCLKGKL